MTKNAMSDMVNVKDVVRQKYGEAAERVAQGGGAVGQLDPQAGGLPGEDRVRPDQRDRGAKRSQRDGRGQGQCGQQALNDA